MPKPLGFLTSDGAQGNAILEQIRNLDTVRSDNIRTGADDERRLDAAADRKQLARDIAAIERATAVLRRAEPALQSWIQPPPTAATMAERASGLAADRRVVGFDRARHARRGLRHLRARRLIAQSAAVSGARDGRDEFQYAFW